MNTHKVTEIFIGLDAAYPANNTAYSSTITTSTAIVGSDMTALNPAGGDTITTQPSIFVLNKLANGDIKKSFEIKGTSVSGYKGISYAPAKREVWAIGYNRATTAGTIEVNNSTNYNFTIRFKNDKIFYSERPEVLNVNFTSAAAATQLTIATQIANAINNSAFGVQVDAIVVGDGTGVYGLTGAANYGVEIAALDVAQFANTSYLANYVYFSVQVDDNSGFGTTTTCTQIQAFDPGAGTYYSVYNKENFMYQYEGVLNRTKFPIPTLAYLSNSTGISSGNIAAFTATGTATEDTVTFSAAASTQLPAGSIIIISGNTYEIKYYISTTVAVLTSVLLTSPAATAVSAKAWYDTFIVEVTDVVTTPGANVGQFAKKQVIIVAPAISSGATAMTTQGAESKDIQDILNDWCASTPGAFANLAL